MAQEVLEGRIPGPSQLLPSGVTLLQIAPTRFQEKIIGCVADRRDFYHQFSVTDEKATRNCIHHALPWHFVSGLKAAEKLEQQFARKRKKLDREQVGDKLGLSSTQLKWSKGSEVAACFGAVFQGDHLGVEVASDAHSSLLSSAGLLREGAKLQAGRALVDDRAVNGLVIDDFFALSREGFCIKDIEQAQSAKDFRKAKAVYKQQNLFGSDDKDVIGADRFVVVGAEVISTDEAVREGVVSVAAPFPKRLGLATISV